MRRPSETDGSASKSDRRAADKQRRASPGNLVGHGGPIKALAVDAATGRALTGSFDYAMMVWGVAAEDRAASRASTIHNGAVNAVAFVPGSRMALAAGDDGAVALWDLETGKLAHRFLGHEAKIVGLAVSADGRWAASASWDRTARLWDLAKREAGPVLSGHQGPVNAVAFSADGSRVYSASADGTIRTVDERGRQLSEAAPPPWLGASTFSRRLPGGERLVFRRAQRLCWRCWMERRAQPSCELPAHEAPGAGAGGARRARRDRHGRRRQA